MSDQQCDEKVRGQIMDDHPDRATTHLSRLHWES